MANLYKGKTFDADEEVSNTDLHDLVDNATLANIVAADISSNAVTNVKINDVSGAKFTNLSSIPSGAGVIPSANIPTSFVAGMIMLWSGAIVSIPAGWLLCDGTSGTPNLRDRFVVGAGSTYAVAGTGGSTTIAEANLPSHAHAAGTLTGGAHTHALNAKFANFTGEGANVTAVAHNITKVTAPNDGTGGNWGTSDVNYSVAESSGAVAVTGSTGAIGSGTGYLQPYYALAYIMKS